MSLKQSSSDEVQLTEKQIEHMVRRFLLWEVPESFSPDAGITYTPHPTIPSRPNGTNILDYTEAKEMVEFMIKGLPKE